MMISRNFALLVLALLAGACDSRHDRDGPEHGNAAVGRGKYLAAIMDCAGCHNVGSFSPKPDEGYLQGGTIGFEVPGMGVFYPPNLTPHPDAGIGKWSEDDIVKAVRTGQRPDGRILAPAMPWHAYSHLTDEDAKALAAYLKTLRPSPHMVPGPSSKENAPQPYLTVAPPAVAGASKPAG
jgi:mono/diheme cytochrome c family protein